MSERSFQDTTSRGISIGFPRQTEYPTYAEMYMRWVRKDGNLLEQLRENQQRTRKLVRTLTEEQLNSRYATNKWSIKEVLSHVIDDERIYAYRALAFARNDQTDLPGFEQEDYVTFSEASSRPIDNIMAEYDAVRVATIALFEGLSDRALTRIGTANGNKTSVRALGWHIAGHELHHLEVIKERYLGGPGSRSE